MLKSLPSITELSRWQSVTKWSMLAIPAVGAGVLALDFAGIISLGRFLVMGAFGIQGLVVIGAFVFQRLDRAIGRREQWFTGGQCRFCGYRVSDLPECVSCPECGHSTTLTAAEGELIEKYRNARGL